MKKVGIGIDLGSSSVRVGLFNLEEDSLIQCVKQKVPYYHHGDTELWEYTQSTNDIITAIETCLEKLRASSFDIKSCGVSATCSMALFTSRDGILQPFSSFDGSQQQNVVFWMDSSSQAECQVINSSCQTRLKDFMGGKFIPEMAIPKICRLNAYLNSHPKKYSVVAMDLHRYLAYELAKRYEWDFSTLINTPNTNEVGHDGELSGWTTAFYDALKISQNIRIGPGLPAGQNYEDFSGIVASCIDCYSSWLSLCSPSPANSLFIVGGTSTCYLYATTRKTTIPGVWGPFTDILDKTNNYAVYEGGQSCTGRLIEHLFQTHLASSSIPEGEWPLLLDRIEQRINDIERETGRSIHFNSKHMFYYGDLMGNRTPYADPAMSGMFIGETIDKSFENLILKYVCILEFLAFQIRYMVWIFNAAQEQNIINEIRICGSQAKNKRLLSLISFVNDGMTIKLPRTDVELSGVSGAFLLGKSALLGKSPLELIRQKIDYDQVETFEAEIPSEQPLLELLDAKYKIHLDMAEQQVNYRKIINKIPGV